MQEHPYMIYSNETLISYIISISENLVSDKLAIIFILDLWPKFCSLTGGMSICSSSGLLEVDGH